MLSTIMQGCPDAIDTVPLVALSLEKMDLEHVLCDLQKYKQWLSSSAWEAWEGLCVPPTNLAS